MGGFVSLDKEKLHFPVGCKNIDFFIYACLKINYLVYMYHIYKECLEEKWSNYVSTKYYKMKDMNNYFVSNNSSIIFGTL